MTNSFTKSSFIECDNLCFLYRVHLVEVTQLYLFFCQTYPLEPRSSFPGEEYLEGIMPLKEEGFYVSEKLILFFLQRV